MRRRAKNAGQGRVYDVGVKGRGGPPFEGVF